MPDTVSSLQRALVLLSARQHLGEALTAEVFGLIMRGEAAPAQIAGLLVGLRVKGETAEELAGAVRAVRDAMVRVSIAVPHLVDTCGTGGGSVQTFNISTAAAFVTAGAGAAVAKHGNRSFTSRCGSADVLEALGVDISLDAAAAASLLREVGMIFLFAPNFHPAMRHVSGIRRELGIASVMNLVGPLVNPAGVRRQVVGVADADRAPLVAEALGALGAEHALIVHARVGMDEISPDGVTDVWEVREGEIRRWSIDPGPMGLAASAGALRGAGAEQNAVRLEAVVSGAGDQDGMAAVLLNAGAAIFVAGLAESYGAGVERAREAITSGAAAAALERLRRRSPRRLSTSE